MTITPSAALMDAIVLSVVARDGTYGYKITQDIRSVMEISESTLYPTASSTVNKLPGIKDREEGIP